MDEDQTKLVAFETKQFELKDPVQCVSTCGMVEIPAGTVFVFHVETPIRNR